MVSKIKLNERSNINIIRRALNPIPPSRLTEKFTLVHYENLMLWLLFMTCFSRFTPWSAIRIFTMILNLINEATVSQDPEFPIFPCLLLLAASNFIVKLHSSVYFQDPYSTKFPGSDSWTTKLGYPSWAQAFIAVMVLLPIAPIFVTIIYYWPSNWRSAFYSMFCSGMANYLPDPSRGGQQLKQEYTPRENEIQPAPVSAVVWTPTHKYFDILNIVDVIVGR